MKKLFYAGFCFLLALPQMASANKTLDDAVKGTPLDGKDNLYVFVGGIVQTLLGLTGIVFVILIIYAGVARMTAGGDAEKVKMSNKIIVGAIIGLIIILSAYALTISSFSRSGIE